MTQSLTPAVGSSEKNLVSKKLRHLEKAVTTAQAGVTSLSDDSTDTALLLQYESHFADNKAQLAQLRGRVVVN